MKQRTFNILVITCLLLIASALGTAQKRKRNKHLRAETNRWYVYVNPDKDFVLSFPGKPTLKDVGPGPLTDLRELEFITADGLRFSANFQDIGGDPAARETNEWVSKLEQIMSDVDRSRGYRVIQMRRVAPNVIEAEIWQPIPETNSQINYLRRSIIRRARIYTLACGWVVDAKPADAKMCQRFFNSMRFTNNVRNKSYPRGNR